MRRFYSCYEGRGGDSEEYCANLFHRRCVGVDRGVFLDRPGVANPPKECVLIQEALWQDGGLGVCSSPHHTVATEKKGK